MNRTNDAAGLAAGTDNVTAAPPGSGFVESRQVEDSPKLGQTDTSSPTVRRFVVSHTTETVTVRIIPKDSDNNPAQVSTA